MPPRSEHKAGTDSDRSGKRDWLRRLRKAELVMIADTRNLGVPTQQKIDEKLIRLCFDNLPIHCQFNDHK
jgi:hypothetical protein